MMDSITEGDNATYSTSHITNTICKHNARCNTPVVVKANYPHTFRIRSTWQHNPKTAEGLGLASHVVYLYARILDASNIASYDILTF